MLSRRSTLLVVAMLVVSLFAIGLTGIPQVATGQAADGRLNCDEAAPVVLYCGADGLDVYGVGDSLNELLLRVPYEDLDIAQPATMTQVGGTSDDGISVYILETGEIQVNVINAARGELWTARWADCPGGPAEIRALSLATGEQVGWEKDSCTLPADVIPSTTAVPTAEMTPELLG
jgi:hypothetical protein